MIEGAEDGNHGEGGSAGAPLILTYRYTLEDYRETHRALLRVSVRERPLLYLGTILMLVLVFVDVNPATVLIAVGAVLQVVTMVGGTHSHARSLHRGSEKRGEFRAEFDAAGVGISTAHKDGFFEWSRYTGYTETKGLFLLVRQGTLQPAGFLAIPKRGLPDPADANNLRALLGRHLTRV